MFRELTFRVREKLREIFASGLSDASSTASLASDLLYQDSLEQFPSAANDAEELSAIIQRLESFFTLPAERDGNTEDKILHSKQCHLLAEAVIAHNEFLFHHLLPLATKIDDHLRLWNRFSPREPGRVWIPMLMEKTPWYWYRFLVRKDVRSPTEEVREHIDHLTALRSHVLCVLGAGNRLLSFYSESSLYPSHHQQHEKISMEELLGLIAVNQNIIRLCITSFYEPQPHIPEQLRNQDAQELEKALSNAFKDHPPFTQKPSATLTQLYATLKANVQDSVPFVLRVRRHLSEHVRPSHLQANWMRYSVTVAAGLVALRLGSSNWQTIVDGALNGKIAVRNFLTRYIIVPMQDIYKTIRYEQTSLKVMDAQELRTDELSLRRMVENFIQQRGIPVKDANELRHLLDRAEMGDLQALMPTYEKEIQAPLKNALFGHLVQLLLIQVQRQRLDIGRAMMALDKLMRSNELNFQVLALVPAVFILGLVSSSAYNYMVRPRQQKTLVGVVRDEVRSVSRLLNFAMPSPVAVAATQVRLSLENTGALLLSLSRLQSLATSIPAKQRALFEEDIADLASESVGVTQKIGTIERMYRTYAFLAPTAVRID